MTTLLKKKNLVIFIGDTRCCYFLCFVFVLSFHLIQRKSLLSFFFLIDQAPHSSRTGKLKVGVELLDQNWQTCTASRRSTNSAEEMCTGQGKQRSAHPEPNKLNHKNGKRKEKKDPGPGLASWISKRRFEKQAERIKNAKTKESLSKCQNRKAQCLPYQSCSLKILEDR